MFRIGVFELLIIAVIVGLIVVVLGGAFRGLRRPRFGHVKLNCPHCDAETRADLPTCQQCGKDL